MKCPICHSEVSSSLDLENSRDDSVIRRCVNLNCRNHWETHLEDYLRSKVTTNVVKEDYKIKAAEPERTREQVESEGGYWYESGEADLFDIKKEGNKK